MNVRLEEGETREMTIIEAENLPSDAEGDDGLVILDNRIVPADGTEEYADIRRRILDSRERIDLARWDIAGDLYKVHDSSLFQTWGYFSFDEYVSVELSMSVRTAHYLTSVYHCFYIELSKDMDEEQHKATMERVNAIGWTKARSLVGVVNGENVNEWLDKAEGIGSIELEGETKRELVRLAGGDPDDVEKMKNISMRVSEEQHEIIFGAFSLAKQVAESDKRGNLLTLICQDYVATNTGNKSGGQQEIKGRYLDRIGAMIGVRIVAVDKETMQVVHGQDVVDVLTDRSNK